MITKNKKPFTPSVKAQMAKARAKPKEIPCPHSSLVPLEVNFGKEFYPNGIKMGKEIDWSSNIMGAHISRVITYYCANCKTEIIAPERKLT